MISENTDLHPALCDPIARVFTAYQARRLVLLLFLYRRSAESTVGRQVIQVAYSWVQHFGRFIPNINPLINGIPQF